MTDESTDTTLEPEIEDRLWTEYAVVLARRQACYALARHAWGAHVRAHGTARDEITWRVYTRCCDLHHLWQDREKAAYVAWKKVAYPLYGWGTSTEEY